ncbi:MAG: CinA family protein [Erysipelotrichaceae bacterium]|nr:CinA family protein [Erysipelotrichaceae bacterium]MCI9312315.1 CinA family protein [Erysipelotrichaceae bacterium]
MEELFRLLKEKGLTIGSCESLTAGLFTSMLASISGASAVLKGGIVAYHSEVKVHVVGVSQSLIDTYGVISAPCAAAMAQHARKLLDCDLCVSFSGNAGPDTMEGKPAGCVYCAIAYAQGIKTYHLQLSGTRNEVRTQAVARMCEEIKSLWKEKGDL